MTSGFDDLGKSEEEWYFDCQQKSVYLLRKEDILTKSSC